MRSQQYTQTARFVIWSIVFAVVGLVYLDSNPIRLSDPDPPPLTVTPPHTTGGNVLVVVDSAAIARAADVGTFSATDFSWSWLNTVEQEIGPCTTIERRDLRNTDLTPFRVVILTHSVAGGDGDEDLIGHLSSYVASGGLMVLERPNGRLRSTFSADGSAGVNRPDKISGVRNVNAPWDAALLELPLLTTYVGSRQPAPDAVTYMSMDGVPVVYAVHRGEGSVVTVEFDYGRQVVALQQGMPREDFSVPDRYTFTRPSQIQTIDLVTSKPLFDNKIPWADLLEKFMVHAVFGDMQPIIAVWPFKDRKQGALLMSHSETLSPNEATWMSRWEMEQGYRSTVFVTVPPHKKSEDVARLRKLGADVQLLWQRPQDGEGLFEDVGLWDVFPFARPVPLQQQATRLRELLPARRPLRISRSHKVLWGPGWSDPFYDLAREEILVDSSLGPSVYGRGYLFGTGMPFRAISDKGLPMPVDELPFVLNQNLENVDSAFVRDLFYDSRDGTHEALCFAFDPDTYGRTPSVELFDLWVASFLLADETQHWVTDLTTYHRFWKSRLSASVKARVRIEVPNDSGDTGGRKLQPPPIELDPDAEVAPVDLVQAPPAEIERRPPNLVLELEVMAPEEGHSILVPGDLEHREFYEARTTARNATTDDVTTVGATTVDIIGHRSYLLPLKEGFNAFSILYR